MFGGVKVAHPSCQIRHAVTCSFFYKADVADESSIGPAVVLASLDRIWVYALNATAKPEYDKPLQNQSRSVQAENDAHVYLECLAEYVLHGTLLDLAWVPLTRNAGIRDSLVLAFAEAKISVVEYDPLLHDLRTISMHYYEDGYEATQDARQQWNEQVPAVRADITNGRFIVARIYDTKIAVIACDPTVSGGISATAGSTKYSDNRLNGPAPADQMLSHVIDCSSLPVGSGVNEHVKSIVDLQIVPTLTEQPTIVLLCRREATGMMSDSHYGMRWNDSCFIVVVTIDYCNKSLHHVWTASRLPSDCCRIMCMPNAGGGGAATCGFVLIAHSIVAFVKQGTPTYAVSISDKSSLTATNQLPIQQKMNFESTFVGAKCEFIERDKLLIGSNSGRLYVLTLVSALDKHTVCSMNLQYVGMSTATSCISLVVGEYVFIGSRLGDSLLMRCRAFADESLQRSITSTVQTSNAIPLVAETVTASRGSNLTAVEMEDEEIYGDTAALAKSVVASRTTCMKSFSCTEEDTLPCYGPFTDAACAEIPAASDISARNTLRKTLDRPLEIMTTSGCGNNGGLCLFRRSVRPLIQASASVHRISDVWSITTDSGDIFLLASIGGMIGLRTVIYKVSINNSSLGSNDAGVVTMKEVEKSCAFARDEPTLYASVCPAASTLATGHTNASHVTNVLQITATKIILITSSDFTCPPDPAAAESDVSANAAAESGSASSRTARLDLPLWRDESEVSKSLGEPASTATVSALSTAATTPVEEISCRAAYVHPYLIVQSSHSRFRLFRFVSHFALARAENTESKTNADYKLEPIELPSAVINPVGNTVNITFMGLYEDHSGMFTSNIPSYASHAAASMPSSVAARLKTTPKTSASSSSTNSTTADASKTAEAQNSGDDVKRRHNDGLDAVDVLMEEEFLYGDVTNSSKADASRKRIKTDPYEDDDVDDDADPYSHKKKSVRATPHANETSYFTSEEIIQQLHKKLLVKTSKTAWLYTVDSEQHILRIYSLSNMQLMFTSCYSLLLGARVLHGEQIFTDAGLPTASKKSGENTHQKLLKDCLITGLGVRQTRPYLMYVLDEDVFIYEIFPFYYNNNAAGSAAARLQIAFKRYDALETPLMTRKRVLKLRKADSSQLYVKGAPGWCQLRSFSGLAALPSSINNVARVENLGYSGAFLCSHAPHWLLTDARGQLRHHPMDSDGRIIAFTPILCRVSSNESDTSNKSSTLIAYAYINGREELRVAAFDSQFNYGNYWPVKRIPMPLSLPTSPVLSPKIAADVSSNNTVTEAVPKMQREMPEYIVYLSAQRVYAIVHYVLNAVSKLIHPSTGVIPNEDKIVETVRRDAGAVLAHERQFSVSLLKLHAPSSLPEMLLRMGAPPDSKSQQYNFLPDACFPLLEYEQVTVARSVILNSETHISGKSEYLVLGSVFAYGEDLQCRGRVVVLEVHNVTTAAIGGVAKATTTLQLRSICVEEQKGPVTALCGLHNTGDLCGTVGQRIYVWSLRNGRLVGRAMVDVDIYPCSIESMKGMVFVADAYTSVTMLQYQPEFRTLGVVAKDIQGCASSGAAARQRLSKIELAVDGAQLACLCANDQGDILTMSYEPEHTNSIQGSTLAVRSEFHLGGHCNAIIRARSRAWDSTNDRPALAIYQKRHVNFFFTTCGSIAYFVPCAERSYRRLVMLQTLVSNHCVQRAGLNPRDFRKCSSLRSVELPSRPQRKPMADLNSSLAFMLFGSDEQKELAKKVGCSVDDIVEELTELTRSALVF